MRPIASAIRIGLVTLVGWNACDTMDTMPPAVGVVAGLGGGEYCLAIGDSTLTLDRQIAVASVPVGGSGAPEAGVMAITARLPGRCVALWGSSGDADYTVAPVGGWAPPTGIPGVAVVGGGASILVSGGTTRADLRPDGTPATFRACTSQEGLHLTLWAGEPLRTERLWHAYYSLGYDVEPNCEPADYEN